MQALAHVWEQSGCLRGKRLHAFLPLWIEALKHTVNLSLEPRVRRLLLSVSASSDRRATVSSAVARRLLGPERWLNTQRTLETLSMVDVPTAWLEGRTATFTRSRPNRKGDQTHVGKKSGAVIRQLVGHDRYEGPEATRAPNAAYELLRLWGDFFQPSMKLRDKHRVGSRVHRE